LNRMKNRWYGYYFAALLLAALVAVVSLFFDHWLLGIAGLFMLAILIYLAFLAWRSFARDLESYVSTLSHRIKKVGDEALSEMPIGIVLYNENHQIEWMNRYIRSLLNGKRFFGRSLNDISEQLIPSIKGQADQEIINMQQRLYQ